MTWVLLWLLISLAFAWGWSRALPPKSRHEQALEDEVQAEYLRAWREERERAARRAHDAYEEHA